MPQAILALAQYVDPTPYCCHALAHVQGQALHKCRIDLPAAGRKHGLAPFHGAEYDPMLDGHDAPAPV